MREAGLLRRLAARLDPSHPQQISQKFASLGLSEPDQDLERLLEIVVLRCAIQLTPEGDDVFV